MGRCPCSRNIIGTQIHSFIRRLETKSAILKPQSLNHNFPLSDQQICRLCLRQGGPAQGGHQISGPTKVLMETRYRRLSGSLEIPSDADRRPQLQSHIMPLICWVTLNESFAFFAFLFPFPFKNWEVVFFFFNLNYWFSNENMGGGQEERQPAAGFWASPGSAPSPHQSRSVFIISHSGLGPSTRFSFNKVSKSTKIMDMISANIMILRKYVFPE